MDSNLFSKYQKAVQETGNKKEVIIKAIERSSGIHLLPEEIVLNKKEVSLLISSAKKARLTQVNIKNIISTLGYTLTY